MNQLQNDYLKILDSLKGKIRQARIKAAVAVNAELLGLYWEIGNIIIQQQKTEGWGTKVIKRLAHDLKVEFPDMKGLSERILDICKLLHQTIPNFNLRKPHLRKLKVQPNKKIKLRKCHLRN